MTSLRRRLTLGLLVGFAILFGAGGGFVYFSARRHLYQHFDGHLRTKMLAMAALIKPARDHVEAELPTRLRPLQEETELVAYYQVFDSNGQSLAKSPALHSADLPRQLGTLAQPALWNLVLPDGAPGRAIGVQFVARPPLKEQRLQPTNADPAARAIASQPKAPKPPPPPPVEVGLVVAEDRTFLDGTLGALALTLLGAGGLSLVASVLFIVLMLRNCMTPLQRLASQTAAIDASSLATRFPTDQLPAELAPIAHCLNGLLARLHSSFERERRFSADLAHELRTPIAGLRTTAEVALKFPATADPQPMQDVLAIAGEMEAMVTRLLALARSEQQTIPLQPQTVAVGPLLDSLWQPLRQRASGRQLDASFEIPEDARVETDPVFFRGIVSNLLTNAVDYTPAAGQLRVVFTLQPSRFSLAVTNTVNDLDLADLPHLFRRFWRKDKARSDAEHIGLGLCLAKSFSEMLGLELSAALPGGSRLILTLQGPLRWEGVRSAPR
jgi:signal transduction histidine kinase